MTLWERCDQIIKLIDETLSEVAVTQTATPTIPVGPYGGPRHGRRGNANSRDEMMQIQLESVASIQLKRRATLTGSGHNWR